LVKAINPKFTLSNYRNGSYIQQGCPAEAAEVEKQFPLAIAVYNTGCKLRAAPSAEENVVRLTAPSQKPANAPGIYPFKVSTSETEFSQTVKKYVAWLRLGDEILRIDAASRSRMAPWN